MKPISSELASHMAGEVTTLATCWKLTLRNSTVMGFTSHSEVITFDGVDYLAATGFSPTAIATSADLAVDNLDIEGMLDSSAITESDVLAGLYDYAEVEIFKVNYQDIGQGRLLLRRGWLGEVSLSRHHFVAEVRGLTQNLVQMLGDLYAPACRAKLGDSKCGINILDYTFSATVTTKTSNQQLGASALIQEIGYFDFGKITFTSGNNMGISMEVKEYTPGALTLVFPMPYDFMVDDTFTIEAGCDKRFETCIQRFNNAVNFRGEPHVPGIDKMLQTAGTFGG